MDIGRASDILRMLADGLDPSTGEPAASDSVLQHPDTVRALHLALAASERGESNPPTGSANSYKAWSSDEDTQLCKEFHGSVDFDEIASAHGRSRGAIISRLAALGRIKPKGKDREAA